MSENDHWTPPKLVRWISEQFQNHQLAPPHRLEAELLVSHALGISRADIYLQHDQPCQEHELAEVCELYNRRINREPLAYITGSCGFWTLRLSVGQGVLIPRQDTELIVDAALEIIPDQPREVPYTILELGTGSAIIPLALATERQYLDITTVEVSPEAIHYARINIEHYNDQITSLQNKIHLLQGDRFEAIHSVSCFDLIISNPPYIPELDIDSLAPEVKHWEPCKALSGGENGLEFYDYLKQASIRLLKPGAVLLFEHGYDQLRALSELFAQTKDLKLEATIQDLNQKDRVMKFSKI